MPRRINWLNLGVGLVGIAFVLAYGLMFVISIGRDSIGTGMISVLCLGAALVPAAGLVLSVTHPTRPLMGWRVLALVLCGLLLQTLLFL